MSTRTPATRRSARLASNEATPAPPSAFPGSIAGRTRRASATPGPSTAPSAGAGRTGRGRSGAASSAAGAAAASLPPVQATNSHAYGASGRTSLVDPSRLRSSSASPNMALDSARKSAIARKQDRSPVAPRPEAISEEEHNDDLYAPPSRRTSLAPSSRRSSLAHTSRQSSAAPDDTHAESMSFGPQHEAGIVPPHGLHLDRPTRIQIFRRWISDKYTALRIWTNDHIHRPLTLILVGLLVVYLFSLMLGVDLPQPDGTPLQKARESLYSSMSSAARVTGAVTSALTGALAAKNPNFDKQFLKYQKDHDDLAARYNEVSTELATLKNMLPDLTVVRRKQDGDGYELLDHFWAALESKAAGEQGKGGKMPWDKWFSRNEEMVSEVHRAMSTTDYNAIMAWGLKHYSLITKDEVLTILREHYQQYDASANARYDQKVEAATERLFNKHFKSQDDKVIGGAWVHKTIENLRLSLERPNFMSAKLGATIDPHLTSPTASRPYKRWQSWIYGRALAASPPPNPPIEALRGWEEAGDCWCSSESNGSGRSDQPGSSSGEPLTTDGGLSGDGSGRAQLGVDLAKAVYPTHFVVEHVPKLGSLSPGTAPRDVELWAHVPSIAVRDALEMQLSVASWGGGQCGEKSATMPDDYVCIGTMKYDINGWNHVQTSALEVDFKALEIPIKKVVVRVQSTWGQPRVCLYRTRLLGEAAPGF